MRFLVVWMSFFCFGMIKAQEFFVQGNLINIFREPLPGVIVELVETKSSTITDSEGFFKIELLDDFTSGNLLIKNLETVLQQIPILRKPGENIDLGFWMIQNISEEHVDLPIFSLEDISFDANGFDREQIGSVLNARRDAFLNASAFQFGPTFFRLRGLDNSQQVVQLNGIPMNSFYSGRPQWSQWGGLNDFTNHTQHFSYGISANTNAFGRLLGVSTISLRPSDFRSGSKISHAFSNTTYAFRTMVSHTKVPTGPELGYAFLLSRRWGKQGYVQGTLYDSWSGAALLEKQWSANHGSWITVFCAPNRRGKNAPLTEEVFRLKGKHYNPYWGEQEGVARNSRESKLSIPMIIFNHLWQVNRSKWQLNLAYQWGEQSSSRLLYNGHYISGNQLLGGGRNPDPVYYQYLPSYSLRNTENLDYANAYLSQQELLKNGQIDWNALYEANETNPAAAVYALYEDVQRLRRGTIAIQTTQEINSKILSRWEIWYSHEQSTFFAQPTDLLGADKIWDLDPYAQTVESAQNDLLHTNRQLEIDEPFLYHYDIKSQWFEMSSQWKYSNKGLNAFAGLRCSQVRYLREGHFKNGGFPEYSLGKGTSQNFTGISLKLGLDYAITGRHRLFLNAALLNSPPAYRNVFANPRKNHLIVPESTSEKSIQFNLAYQAQIPNLDFKLSAYGILRNDLQEVSFYFADGVGGDRALFVQELLTGVSHRHLGLEAALVFQPLPELKITGIAALGRFQFANNPNLFLASEIDDESPSGNIVSLGKAYLKNYALSGGPQCAFSLSFFYQNPDYWRFEMSGNYFSNTYLNPNPLTRTSNFYTDYDGLPFVEYDHQTAEKLLTQEKFPPYFLLNATGGKSWRIGARYLGFFISLQNLLNATYKTGGYGQRRNANYRNLLKDQSRPLPLFGPKYWWGRGTTYFATIYFRF